MKYNDFIQAVRNHLEAYKTCILGVNENGTYRGKEYGHILPPEYEKLNLGLPDSEYDLNGSTLCLKNCPPIKLHMDWRHMNSSQILCISYFYEFISDVQKLQKLISEVLKINSKVKSAEFELVTEDGSNIDFAVQLENGGTVYFEIKYTEKEFGSASSKTADYKAIREKYHSAIEISTEDYINQYQFVRNVCLSPDTSNNHTVFLLPKANDGINKKYDDGINAIKNIQSFNVQKLYWEDLLEKIPNKTVLKKYFDI